MNEAQFLESMLKHHQSGLEVAELAVERAQVSYVKDFCQKLQRGHQQEINYLVNHLSRFHQSEVVPESDKKYTAEIDELKKTSDKEFDQKFLQMMIGHHRDMIEMIKNQDKSDFHQEIKELLSDVVNQQSREIGDMEYYLKNL